MVNLRQPTRELLPGLFGTGFLRTGRQLVSSPDFYHNLAINVLTGDYLEPYLA